VVQNPQHISPLSERQAALFYNLDDALSTQRPGCTFVEWQYLEGSALKTTCTGYNGQSPGRRTAERLGSTNRPAWAARRGLGWAVSGLSQFDIQPVGPPNPRATRSVASQPATGLRRGGRSSAPCRPATPPGGSRGEANAASAARSGATIARTCAAVSVFVVSWRNGSRTERASEKDSYESAWTIRPAYQLAVPRRRRTVAGQALRPSAGRLRRVPAETVAGVWLDVPQWSCPLASPTNSDSATYVAYPEPGAVDRATDGVFAYAALLGVCLAVRWN
jgi:hypothetical protein